MEEKIDGVNESSGKEIDLRVVFGIIRKNIILIVLVTVVFAILFFAYSKLFISKQYEASAVLIVNNISESSSTVNNAELTAAASLADVYSIIIKSDAVLNEVINNLNLSTTPEVLKKSINVSTVDSTQVINVSMNSTRSEYAKQVVEEIIKVAPPIIKDKVEAGSVKIISEARISNNGAPVSPNSSKNAIIGALVGLVLVLAFVFVKELANNTFKTEDDIINSLNIPLLGIIPAVETKEFNRIN